MDFFFNFKYSFYCNFTLRLIEKKVDDFVLRDLYILKKEIHNILFICVDSKRAFINLFIFCWSTHGWWLKSYYWRFLFATSRDFSSLSFSNFSIFSIFFSRLSQILVKNGNNYFEKQNFNLFIIFFVPESFVNQACWIVANLRINILSSSEQYSNDTIL